MFFYSIVLYSSEYQNNKKTFPAGYHSFFFIGITPNVTFIMLTIGLSIWSSLCICRRNSEDKFAYVSNQIDIFIRHNCKYVMVLFCFNYSSDLLVLHGPFWFALHRTNIRALHIRHLYFRAFSAVAKRSATNVRMRARVSSSFLASSLAYELPCSPAQRSRRATVLRSCSHINV